MALLTTILLALHLLAMNVASAGPLVCVWLHHRGSQGDDTAFRVGRRLARWTLGLLLVGVAVGVGQLAVAWIADDRAYFDALGRFPLRALVHAAGEAGFSLACLGLYAATWDRWRGRAWLHPLAALLAATNLLYHFPPLMIVLGQLTVRPELSAELSITRNIFRPLALRPEILSQVLHFGVASIAMAGLGLMLIARHERSRAAASTAAANRLMSIGAWIALVASLTQLAVGVWVLVSLPLIVRNGLTGDNWLASGLFLLAIVVFCGVLHSLAIVALGDVRDVTVRRSGLLVVCVVFLMVGVLQTSRTIERQRRGNNSPSATSQNRWGLAHFAESSEQNVPVPFSVAN